ncbi:MAG: hypothetical protein QW632_02215 [Ignisphaera sp.]
MEYRKLGRTNLRVSILAIGGYGPSVYPDAQEVVKAVENAINEGLNIVDIVPAMERPR